MSLFTEKRMFQSKYLQDNMVTQKAPYALLAAACTAFRCTWTQYHYTGPWFNSLIPSTGPYVQHMVWTGWESQPYVLHEKDESERWVREFFFSATMTCERRDL